MTDPAPDLDLVTFDLDGTLVEGTVFQAVAEGEGFAGTVAEIDERYFGGEITLEECFWETWELLEGLEAEACREHVRRADGPAGFGPAVDRLHEAGVEAGILTDQPTFLARARAPSSLDHVLGSEAAIEDGVVTGAIDARFDKREHLLGFLADRGIPAERVAHVGNGRNDVPVFEAVGGSVAANPDDETVAAAADAVVDPFEDVGDAVDELLGSG